MSGYKIDQQLEDLGEHIRGWRMILGLTAQQVADRAGITRATVHKIEKGHAGVSVGNVFQVLRALGVLDAVIAATDPLASDIGKLRAGALTKRRAR